MNLKLVYILSLLTIPLAEATMPRKNLPRANNAISTGMGDNSVTVSLFAPGKNIKIRDFQNLIANRVTVSLLVNGITKMVNIKLGVIDHNLTITSLTANGLTATQQRALKKSLIKNLAANNLDGSIGMDMITAENLKTKIINILKIGSYNVSGVNDAPTRTP